MKVTHHRARRTLAPYDLDRCRPSPALVARSAAALERFLRALATADVAMVEALLAKDVRVTNDGGGEFLAARKPILGAARAARFFLGIARYAAEGMRLEPRILNGLPALVIEPVLLHERLAPRYVLRCEIDREGLITALHTVLATRKLTQVSPIGASPDAV